MTNSNKIQSEEKIVESEVKVEKNNSKDDGWHIGKIFWGLLFVLIGGLAFAGNFGYVDVQWDNLWRLWPIFIIALGLSMISMKNVIWRIIVTIMAILTLGGVAWVMVGNYQNSGDLQSYTATIQKASDKVKQAVIKVQTGASSLQIGTTNQEEIANIALESNVANLSKTSEISGETQKISIGMSAKSGSDWLVGNTRNLWDIDLTRNLPLTLNVESGASNIDIDVSEAQLTAMDIRAGVSNIVVKLGNREDLANVYVESGVSSIIFKIPEGSGVQLKLEGGLISKNISGLEEITDNVYQTTGYEQAKKQVNISGEIGVSSFSVERY